MANFNFSLSGTRSTGASTIGDWTDANCYPVTSITAVTQAAANGDTIFYNETNTGAAASVYIITAGIIHQKGITIDTRYGGAGDGAILEKASGGSLSHYSMDSTAPFVMSNLKLSGANIGGSIMEIANSTIRKDITFNDVEWIGNGAQRAIVLQQANGSLTLNNPTFSGNYLSSIVFGSANFGLNSTMDFVANNTVFDNASINSAGYGYLLRKADTANNVSVNISGVSGVITGATGNNVLGIIVEGCDEVNIDLGSGVYRVVSTDAANASYCVNVYGVDAVNRQTVDAVVLAGEEAFLDAPAGTALSCGQDIETGLNWTVNPTITGGTINGPASTSATPHGISLQGLSTGQSYGCHIKRMHSPVIHSKCTNDAVESHGHLITDCYGSLANRGVPLSLKGNSGGVMHNNTVVITPNSIDGAVSNNISAIWSRAQDVADNTASKTYNNNILWLGMPMPDFGFVNVAVGHATTFSSNNYYTDQTLPTSPFTYAGANYSDLAAWNSAQETNDATGNPIFNTTIAAIIAAFGNLPPADLAASVATIGGGEKWWGNNPRPDTILEPLPDTDIDKGIQSSNSPNHPTNI